jgi:hypothetical protein
MDKTLNTQSVASADASSSNPADVQLLGKELQLTSSVLFWCEEHRSHSQLLIL